jgi:hypothetical protein
VNRDAPANGHSVVVLVRSKVRALAMPYFRAASLELA